MARFSAGTILVGITAVLFGLLGAYVVRKELNKPVAEKKAEEAKATIVPVASTDIPAGRQLTLGDIALLKLTPEQLKKTGLSKKPFMNNTKQIIGRIVQRAVKKGETFDTEQLYPEGTGPTVAEKLQPGYRAVTVPVEVDAAVAGFATPGSVVDVFFRSNADEEEDVPEMTVPLIEAVQVLALNKEMTAGKRAEAGLGRSKDTYSVTLAVRPEHVSALQVTEGHGKLSLALRNGMEDVESLGPMVRTLDELLQRPGGKHRIEVYRGRSLSEVEFRRTDRLTPSRDPVLIGTRPTSVPVAAPSVNPPTNVPETADQQ